MKILLKEKRKAWNLTQKQVAERIGIQCQSYQRYENQEVIPTVYTAIRLAKTLNATVEEIFGED